MARFGSALFSRFTKTRYVIAIALAAHLIYLLLRCLWTHHKVVSCCLTVGAISRFYCSAYKSHSQCVLSK